MNDRAARGQAKPSICFVALKAYGLLSGRKDIQHIGGAEVQQTLIARELARRGYAVSFVVLDHDQPDGEVVDGIRVFKAYRPSAGVRGVRFVHPRLTGLWSAMRRANSDVYYQRCAGTETGLVANWCRRNRRRFVFSVGANPACADTFSSLENTRERLLYQYGLRRADYVISQTRAQQRLLIEKFEQHSVVIPSCAVDPGEIVHVAPSPRCPPRLLWVGRFSPVKDPDYLLDLAELCPTCHFDVLGDDNALSALGDSRAGSAYANRVKDRARQMPNVELHGWVRHADTGKYYSRASALVCTSHSEGFPNTFLEAWSRGLPVVSRIDIDDVISDHRLGVVHEDRRELANRLNKLVGTTVNWEACSRRVREYFIQQHTIDHVVDRYEDVWNGAVQWAIERKR